MHRLFVLLSVLLALAGPAAAQTATGTLSGTIRDTTGAVLPRCPNCGALTERRKLSQL